MNYILGFILAITGFIFASIHLGQGISSYWDQVAFFVVVFGSVAVVIMGKPKMNNSFIFKNFQRSIMQKKKDKKGFIKNCLNFLTSKNFDSSDLTKIENQIIADGIELMSLGFDKNKIEQILSDRFFAYKKSITNISNWLKRSSKYPPAFGLAGTVLGLIHLMRGISEGSDPKETGVRMAIALVATFYGLILSNLVLNPIAENILESVKEDEDLVEISIKTIMLMCERSNLVESQEALNSFASIHERVDMISELNRSAA